MNINRAYGAYLNEYARTQIFFGGSASGKSWFLAQRCVFDLMRGGRNYLICRQVARTIRTSTFQQVERVIREAGLLSLFDINRSAATITNRLNGHQALFAGLDDVEKIKSIVPRVGALTDIWIEEATETERGDVLDLYKRQRGGDEKIRKRMILSFNPILQSHWIYHDFFASIAWDDYQREYKDGDLLIIKTTYKDNAFLTQQDLDDLENEKDKYRYDVYTLGKWGVLGHVVFRNWRVEDLSAMRDSFDNIRCGLDFGFADDPAALWISHYDKRNRRIYVFDEVYERGLTNDMLAERLREKIGNAIVWCDSAEPKSIAELRKYGINARPARKGRDSRLFGIKFLQAHEIIIDKNCVNAKAEISAAHWDEDAGGNALPQMTRCPDHLIDAARYAHEHDALSMRPQTMSGSLLNFSPNRMPQNAQVRSEEEVERMLNEYKINL